MSSEAEYWQRIAGGVRAEIARQRRTASDLTDILHLSRNSVYRRVNGEVPFDLNEITLVSSWLGVPTSAFEYDPRPLVVAVAA